MRMNKVLGIVAVVCLLAGCGNDNEVTTPETDARVALQVSSGIDVKTRAHDDTWDANDAIGIYMLNTEVATVAENAANRKYTTEAADNRGIFTPAAADQTIYFPVDGTARDFIAYYPYRTLAAGNTAYDVDVTTQTAQKDIDLMGADRVTGKSKNNPNAAFTFTHKLVKLSLTIKTDNISLTDANLQGMTVKLSNQRTRAAYDIVAGGAVTVDTETPATDITLLTADDGRSAQGIVLPDGDTEGMELQFILQNGNTFSWAVKNAALSQKFDAGSKYIYNITIGSEEVGVTSTVTDWAPGNGGGENGSAE